MPGISRKDLLCPLPHWRNLWIPTHQNLNGGDPLLGEFEELSYRLQAEFEIIVWRSLANGPPLDELLSSLLKFLMPPLWGRSHHFHHARSADFQTDAVSTIAIALIG
jgi:hypothetical protein